MAAEAEAAVEEVHSAEQAAEMEALADEEVSFFGFVFCFDFFCAKAGHLFSFLFFLAHTRLVSFSLFSPTNPYLQAASDAEEAEAREVQAEFQQVSSGFILYLGLFFFFF